MKKIVIFQWDLAKAIEYKPRRISKIPPLPVHMELLANDQNANLLIQIGRDPLLHQRLVDVCKPVFWESAKRLEVFLKNWDEISWGRIAPGPGVPAGADEARGLKLLDEKYKSEEKTSQEAVKMKWDALLTSLGEEREQYKDYKKEVVVKVTVGAFGFVAAAVAVGVSAWTGGVSALAIVGLYRAIANGFKTILDLCKDAEGIQGRLKERIEGLRASFDQKKKSRKWAITKDLGSAFLNEFLPIQLGNIKTAQSDAELLMNKFCGVRVEAHDLSEKLNELLEKTEDLDEQYWNRTFVGLGAQPAKTRAEKAYQKMTQNIIDWLEQIPNLHLRAENGIPKADELAKELAQLQKNVPGWVEHFENLVPLVVSLGLAVGSIHEAVEAEKLAEKTAEAMDAAANLSEVLHAAGEELSAIGHIAA